MRSLSLNDYQFVETWTFESHKVISSITLIYLQLPYVSFKKHYIKQYIS